MTATGLPADALAVVERWPAPNPAQERLRAICAAHLREHADGVFRSCFPTHVTAGALVLDADGGRVLLNLHRKARRWFAFGGHVEPGDQTLSGAALREGREESGIDSLEIDPVPVHISAHTVDFCDPRGPVTHLDVRFAARAPVGAEPAISEESLDARWFASDAVPTDEPDMLDLIALARARLAGRG